MPLSQSHGGPDVEDATPHRRQAATNRRAHHHAARGSADVPTTAAGRPRLAFPLGGIGTGNVSIGARGELRDWELENHPDKGRTNPYSFFAIHAVAAGNKPVTKVLESRMFGAHDVDEGYPFSALAGLPRLDDADLHGEYPFVEVDFVDADLPVTVRLEAFTPLIPLNSDDSGIPAAVLRYQVTNPGATSVEVSVAGAMSHTAGMPLGARWAHQRLGEQSVTWREADGVRGLFFDIDLPHTSREYGTLALVAQGAELSAFPRWPIGPWADGAQLFWDDFSSTGRLRDHGPTGPEVTMPEAFFVEDADVEQERPKLRTGSVASHQTIRAGETAAFEFVLTWHFPNRPRRWEWDPPRRDSDVAGDATATIRNHYATLWNDAWGVARYLVSNQERLESGTRAFHQALYSSTLPESVLDAVGANISALRSTTCFRIEGGTFLAWEGSMDREGSCSGTCTHVWSYAQTVAWLFPDLERSARRVEYLVETTPEGLQRFRTLQVLGQRPWGAMPAVDGQFGTLLRLYREWRFSGDDAFLREVWPAAKRTLEYGIREWDRDGDGLLDALMHNTYDIEFDGAEPLSNVMFLAALRAASRLAEHLGDPDRARYAELAERSRAAIESRLFDGEWYVQRCDDVDALRYQYGTGVLSDQLLGQFHAHVNGLGLLLDADRVRSAMLAVYRYNFRSDLSDHASTQRTFALNDDGGLLLASWPRGGRPTIPFVYSDEVWTGIEYQVAAELAYLGDHAAAEAIVSAVRARYDGRHRNPWNEIECGNHYARSMASWALLLAYSGVQYDAPTRSLKLDPARDGSYFLSTGSGWGRAVVAESHLTLCLDYGELELERVVLRGTEVRDHIHLVAGDKRQITFATADPSTTAPREDQS